MRDTEIFWIVRNGIRMTGMPSFGITYPDAKLWEMVALVKSLPRMPPQEYLKISGNR
jgi:mono/diheme cytochrome c family protein